MLRWNWKMVMAEFTSFKAQHIKGRIYVGNCLGVVGHKVVDREANGDDKPDWVVYHEWWSDEKDLENWLKDSRAGQKDRWLNLTFNTFYKDSWKIAKHFVKHGIPVKLIYKVPSWAKKKGVKHW